MGAGTVTALAGVALTGLSGWLVLRAAEMPPVLTLLVAIVGVRGFGLLRAVARWAERLAAHDAALRLAAGTRVRVWRALARQGLAADRTPGAALARAVGDVGLLQDLSVRVVTPPAVAAATALLGCGLLALLSPAAAGGALAVLLLTAAVVAVLHRRVDAEAARTEADLRVRALQEAAAVLEGAVDLRAHGLATTAGARVQALAAAQRAAAAGAVRAAASAEAAVVAGTGLAGVAAAALGWATGCPGRSWRAGPRAAGLRRAADRLGRVTATTRRVDRRPGAPGRRRRRPGGRGPDLTGHPPGSGGPLGTSDLAAGWPGGPDVLRDVDLTADRDGWLVVRGPSGAGKSTLLAVLMASLRPRAGRYDLAGVPAGELTGTTSGRRWRGCRRRRTCSRPRSGPTWRWPGPAGRSARTRCSPR